MAIFNLSDKAQRILTVSLTAVATVFLGISSAYGWAIPWYGTVANVLAILVPAIFGIEWVPPIPKKE